MIWISRKVLPSSLRAPEPDGKHRLHLCYDQDDCSAAVSLAADGKYFLGYDGAGWSLGTADLREAMQRAEILLGWTGFVERAACSAVGGVS